MYLPLQSGSITVNGSTGNVVDEGKSVRSIQISPVRVELVK